MKPLTMGEGKEQEIRAAVAGPRLTLPWTECKKLLAEIDALRTRVSEVERDAAEIAMDMSCEESARSKCMKALAASQAEARELREALTQLIPEATRGRSCAHTWNAPCAACRASALLSRPHGDDTALREMLTEAVAVAKLEGMKGQQYVTGGYGVSESDLCSDESIVNRILGQPGDDAKEG